MSRSARTTWNERRGRAGEYMTGGFVGRVTSWTPRMFPFLASVHHSTDCSMARPKLLNPAVVVEGESLKGSTKSFPIYDDHMIL